MGLYIKGLDMPKEVGKMLHLDINQYGEVWLDDEYIGELVKEIPTPHGDLIDRDIVRDECYKTMEELMQMTTINLSAEALSLLCGFTIINDAPAIIKAED